MSDFKSKLPDLKELTSIASKLFKDVKTSVSEIIADYKQKREQEAPATKPESSKKKESIKTTQTKKSKPTSEGEKKDNPSEDEKKTE